VWLYHGSLRTTGSNLGPIPSNNWLWLVKPVFDLYFGVHLEFHMGTFMHWRYTRPSPHGVWHFAYMTFT
jgi:hypothetical protein